MDGWILTMILTFSSLQQDKVLPLPNHSITTTIHTQEYTTKERCEAAIIVFVKRPTNPSKDIDENKIVFCTKK